MDLLDRRHMVHESGWHWGDGVQYEAIRSLPELAAKLEAHSGMQGLQLIDPAADGPPPNPNSNPPSWHPPPLNHKMRTHPVTEGPRRGAGFAAMAAALFHRDGFVCVRDALPAVHLQALRECCEQAMQSIVAADQYGGAKGAWRYMFGGSSKTGPPTDNRELCHPGVAKSHVGCSARIASPPPPAPSLPCSACNPQAPACTFQPTRHCRACPPSTKSCRRSGRCAWSPGISPAAARQDRVNYTCSARQSRDFVCFGGGGDFCLPGSEYQVHHCLDCLQLIH